MGFQVDKTNQSGFQGSVPIGGIVPYTGDTAPTGYLMCDGSAISRALYPQLNALYAGIIVPGPYPFGNGDGVTTFNLPDLRSRSLMGAGTGSGLSARVLGTFYGEENHVLTVGELATHNHSVTDPGHNHTQNAHTHVQNSHTHVQNSHTHTQDAHTHVQDAHTHVQNAHTHTVTDPGHSHGLNGGGSLPTVDAGGAYYRASVAALDGLAISSTSNPTNITNQNTTATNQNTTATNQNTTATNQSTTATNQNTTATNQNATATNNSNITSLSVDNNGSNTGHNTIHPVMGVNFIVRYI